MDPQWIQDAITHSVQGRTHPLFLTDSITESRHHRLSHGDVAKWLRQRSAKPLFGGSSPPVASTRFPQYTEPLSVSPPCDQSALIAWIVRIVHYFNLTEEIDFCRGWRDCLRWGCVQTADSRVHVQGVGLHAIPPEEAGERASRVLRRSASTWCSSTLECRGCRGGMSPRRSRPAGPSVP